MTEGEADRCVRDLFLTWYPTAVRCAYRLCGSLEAAEDTVQEAFRELFVALRKGVTVQNPKAWTYQVIRREIARNYKDQLRRAECLEPSDVMDLRPALDPREEAALTADELTQLLSLLAAREEEVLLLRMQGLRYQEIATALDISINSVKTMLARALRKLQGAGDEPPLPRGFRKFKKYVTRTLY